MLQGFGATDSCGAGCAQHWIAHSILHVRLCLPAHFASVARLTSSIAYMQAIELGTKHLDSLALKGLAILNISLHAAEALWCF